MAMASVIKNSQLSDCQLAFMHPNLFDSDLSKRVKIIDKNFWINVALIRGGAQIGGGG
jgi:hypothetical protein